MKTTRCEAVPSGSSFLFRIYKFLVAATALVALVSSAFASAGDTDLTFDAGSALNRPASAIAVQSDGKILIGGSFTTVGGLVRHRIARLNSDGSGDPSFDPGTGANDFVNSIAVQSDGKVLLGGGFTNVAGVNRGRIARLNGDGSLDSTFYPGTGANGMIFSVSQQSDGKVLVGGYFTAVNGVSRNYLARLNSDGRVDASFNPGSGANDYVYAIVVQPDGKIIIGGLFTTFNGTSINRIARLNSDGTLDPSFNPGTGVNYFGVTSLALQPDGRVLLGGIFTSVNGVVRNNLARLNGDGSQDTTFNPGAGPNGEVSSIAIQTNGKIVIGGQFTSFNSMDRKFLVQLNSDGSLDTSFNSIVGPYPPGVARVAAQPDGRLLVGGWINTVGNTTRNFLARLNADGSADSSFNPSTGIAGSHVGSMVVQPDGKIVIGGNFTDVVGADRGGVARLERDGSLDPSFDPGEMIGPVVFGSRQNPVVYSIALQPDGKVLIGGSFTAIQGQSRNGIARLNPDGTLDDAFNPGSGADYNVYRILLQQDGKVLIAGGFLSINAVSREYLARLNADGSLDESFNPKVGEYPQIALQSDGKVLLGGYFTEVNGISRNYVARLNSDGSLDTSFDPGTGPNDSLNAILALADGKILISGGFTNVAGVGRNQLARLNADGSLDLEFDPGSGPGGSMSFTLAPAFVEQPDGKLLVWGEFTNFNSMPRNGIVRLNTNASVDTTFNPGTGIEGEIYCMALQADSRIVIGGGFWSYNGVPRAFVARLLGDAPVIITQPANRTNWAGTTATFTVVASGASPLSYQWFKNGVPLTNHGRVSGATSATLTLAGVNIADAARYVVTVSNSAGSVVSDGAFLRVRVPPIAQVAVSPVSEFHGVTNRFVISPNNTNALAVLDGSGSSSGEGGPLRYLWSEGTNTLSEAVTVTNLFQVGEHAICLTVDDGASTGTNVVIFEVIKPSKAVGLVMALIEQSQLPPRTRRSLLARLELTAGMFERGRFQVGIHLLRAFQHVVRAQVNPQDLASNLIEDTEEIVDALAIRTAPTHGPGHSKINQLSRSMDGHTRLQFSVTPGRDFVIEASTNLTDWEVINVHLGNGQSSFDFEDSEAAKLTTRFYRIVTP